MLWLPLLVSARGPRAFEIGFAMLLLSGFARAAETPKVCQVTQPTASLTIHHKSGPPSLGTNPDSAEWKTAGRTTIVKDCTHEVTYEPLSSEVRGFWTDTDLYLLFRCPYKTLNLFLPAMGGGPRMSLWDRDVVEMFLGDDWKHIRHYREFEIAPTGDWIDLAIDLDKQSFDHTWRSGWKTAARIDEATHTWYAAAQIPLSAVSQKTVTPGTKWRANLYRIEGQGIEGQGKDAQRHFLCWQPTCDIKRGNHVPESFGTLVFAK